MTHDSIEKQPQAGLSRRTALRLAAVGAGVLATASSVGWDVLPASAAVLWNHPFKGTRGSISSVYGYSSDYGPDFHKGIDYSPPFAGTDIHSVSSGTVVAHTLPYSWAGNAVVVRHSNGWHSAYFHMQTGSIVVSVGQSIAAGQKIGKMGSTGEATGAHLHVEIWAGSSRSAHINPYDYIHNAPLAGSTGAPISGDDMPTALSTTRTTDVALQTLTTAVADGPNWPILPYKNSSNTATNIAETDRSATIFSCVATFYIKNLPAGETVSIRGTRWKISDDSKSGLAATMIVGTGQEVVRGQYVFNTDINQSTHRLAVQAYASVPGVVVDYWGIAGQTW
ncbi:MAG: M23 family metallopeptidase [Salinibacterium amurskyense]